ncbi:hypothetical protein P8631_09125 [Guyparkeria sp. 1SP6A2]|nr:hypothetical protein [Guyparkeria sp. 1SP6A2]
MPVLSDVLGTANPGLRGWATVPAFSLLPLIVVQPMKRARLLWEGRWIDQGA